jgi:hypothetical protein
MSDAGVFAEKLKEVRRHLAEPVIPVAAEEGEYRAYASGRVGNRPQVSVTFRGKDGLGKTLAYCHLYSLDDENPNLGATLEFTRHRVVVKGRNLTELVRLLGDHKVREVQETDEMHALTLAPEAPVVTTVQVLDKRDGAEW